MAGQQRSHLGAQVPPELMEGSALSLPCPARRVALNAFCPMDGDWHTRSQTQPVGRELRDSPGWLQRGDPVAQGTPELMLGRRWPGLGTSRSVGPRASRPCSPPFSPGGGVTRHSQGPHGNSAAMELPGTGPVLGRHNSFLSQVWGWVGQLCVGVAFFSLF